MAILFGVFWVIAAIAIGLLIQGDIFKNKLFFKLGLALIVLSFICGFSLLVAVIATI
jgi:hypothetical protein